MSKLNPRLVIPSNLKLSLQASATLDFVRGIAAFFVMIGHLRALFFVPYAEVEHSNFLVKIVYLLTGFGYQAVVVFFVLSGFFISSSIFKMHSQGRWSWPTYLTQRLVRLWVVLIPALLLTAFWDSLGIHFFGKSVYLGLPYDKAILGFSTIARLNIQTFLSNAFFLQGIATPTFGSNGPLWSLSYEFWYYIAFPCALNMFLSPSKKAKIFYGVVILALGIFVGKSITLSFAIWLLGVVVIFLPYLWYNHKPIKSYVIGVAIVPFAAALILSVSKNGDNFSWPIALSFAGLMYLLFRLTYKEMEQDNLSMVVKFSKSIAGFSYSLYLFHLPLLVFLHAYSHSLSSSKWQPTGQNLTTGVFIAFFAVLYAWMISLLTEAKTPLVRNFIKRKYKI